MGCSNGACELAEQQNVLSHSDYKRRCSQCNAELDNSQKYCPTCKHGLPYWSYEPDDGLTDYQQRMIKRFYGNLTDTKIVLNHDR